MEQAVRAYFARCDGTRERIPQKGGGFAERQIPYTLYGLSAAVAMKTLRLIGKPNPKQQAFFLSTAPHTAYGGVRGGGKSWAMRRKLVLLTLRYPGLVAAIGFEPMTGRV